MRATRICAAPAYWIRSFITPGFWTTPSLWNWPQIQNCVLSGDFCVDLVSRGASGGACSFDVKVVVTQFALFLDVCFSAFKRQRRSCGQKICGYD